MPLLEVHDLRKDFGGFAAVDGFNLVLEEGALHALVGPNGCGKSTLFNLITGALTPSGGRVVFDGADITGQLPHQIARLGIGRKFQVPSVFDELTVAENLVIPRDTSARDAEAVLQRIKLADKRDEPAGDLSHGERQWLELGMLLVSGARLLLLDEPTAGMTHAETDATADLISGIAAEGDHTFIVIEHDMGFIQRLDCRVTVMANGRPLMSGSYADIRAADDVRELYFGRNP